MMEACPPNHFRSPIRYGAFHWLPISIPYRGLRVVAAPSGGWRAMELGNTIIACPIEDGEDLRWDVTFATKKGAKMGIDRYISWLVPYRLALEALRRA